MTLLEKAKKGELTPEIESVAKKEGIHTDELFKKISEGKVIIPKNINRRPIIPCGIGEGLTTKVNANIGTSPEHADLNEELLKIKAAVSAGADSIMDLSTGGDIEEALNQLLDNSDVIVGTVPIYQAAVEAYRKKESIAGIKKDDFFKAIEKQAEAGVDFMTIHCGVTLKAIEMLEKGKRITGIVSRGGSIISQWIKHNGKENPYFDDFDRLLEILKKYDITLSLGDGLRPGCLNDATDRPQIQELILLGELTERAWECGVQVMIEGPGHVPINQIETNIVLQKKLCKGAPFYVLGPLVTDIAPGYDHITSAIGGALAASYGADFLCYVTSSEHLRLPTVEDVREGVMVTKIAAHAADIAKGIKGAIERDNRMSLARKNLDWEEQMRLSIDPEKAGAIRKTSIPKTPDVCTMCGVFCSMRGEMINKP
ncbi:MAG: phosphomethylpyrimidine synthase [Candidatus Schekmanbacteria bacterium RIFCSPHIGHO2_02_FULL_38_11]|uniref:Phosphomethylpyrimidine synthase n=1 Tax=Candidatus Schekmanbacteria bacterium RIFCSPLOWO2_12_FULL_38_15 TaxID=1817883 RepID=A0A1F7SNN3_9BACT|nr:MAG: phosphomethylpyrimidine synthase [Candidatus Schekmanbacteria bacterium GWA2_38_9]OGL49829.1 MAG: phosphomethylpyrimidine synthase [Candidatus Schekmanbacteria bacterium RIFCSPHIGHO2_02_FULL_38_11]OGL50289.1 MAG: phosphomethylpyrimidine synthase [Candidatus Schekmanbacteria bacterium RIFCSPLOWO2_02_FULL_38_14]OGL55400.1 MAG: phosphomethylpyrimidine synthase [Candidatus Schekmanbacteria bacterium RIFCSPLOWO2_12_FULL_38_15]